MMEAMWVCAYGALPGVAYNTCQVGRRSGVQLACTSQGEQGPIGSLRGKRSRRSGPLSAVFHLIPKLRAPFDATLTGLLMRAHRRPP